MSGATFQPAVEAARKRRWFITGVSSGFGRELARAAVKAGDVVVGTVRSSRLIAELAAENIEAVVMDVDDDDAVAAAAEVMARRHGGPDVLVNNAGFGLLGAIEALAMDDVRACMETNFFGAFRVTRAFIPHMRERGGAIVMISSLAGQVGLAGTGAYAASKFALEGFSDALAEELATFAIEVMIVEPGAFRTDFSGRSIKVAETVVAGYGGTPAGEVKALMAQYHGHEPGDPAKAAAAILCALDHAPRPRRLALGGDAVEAISAKLRRMEADLDAWRHVSMATALDDGAPEPGRI